MSVTASPAKIVATLWRRAPLWRLTICSAALATLVFVANPPSRHGQGQVVADQASYTPPTASADDTPHAAPTPSPVKAAVPPVTSEPHNQTVPPPPKVAPAEPVRPPAVQTATLSLATPEGGAAGSGESGLNGALLGPVYRGSIEVNGFKLPLPDGDWALLASQTVNFATSSGTDYFFGRIKDKRLIGAIIAYAIKTNAASDSIQSPLTQSAGCDRTTILHMSAGESSGPDLPTCWYIYNYFTGPMQKWADRAVKMDNLSRAAAGDLAAKGVTYPQDLIAAQFVHTEKWGLLFATYLFNPETDGIKSDATPSWLDSNWSYRNIGQYPEKAAYVEKLKQWGTSFWPKFKAALAVDTDSLHQLADKGDANAQYRLGILYATGQGVPQSFEEAMKWYRQAAEQSHADAQTEIGSLYFRGLGVPKDYDAALDWFHKAAEQNNANAIYDIGVAYDTGSGVQQDFAQAAIWYENAANLGNISAANNLGILYENGRGVPRDDAIALSWYRKAADKGNVNAQKNLADFYANGRGTPVDDKAAVAWYRKAAIRGHADAHNGLGAMYTAGRGVPKNLVLAYAHFQIAAARGCQVAIANGQKISTLLTSSQIEEGSRLAARWRPGIPMTETTETWDSSVSQ